MGQYQNINAPIFYVSILPWLQSRINIEASGTYVDNADVLEEDILKLISLYPASNYMEGIRSNDLKFSYKLEAPYSYDMFVPNTKCFQMWLGHDYQINNANLYLTGHNDEESFDVEAISIATTGKVNFPPSNKGWSLAIGDNASDLVGKNTLDFVVDGLGTDATANNHICSLLYGTYYNDFNPDMNLTLEYVYDGVKSITTKGGSSLSSAHYLSPPLWGPNLSPWNNYSSDTTEELSKFGRSGRRQWQLSFSFLADSKVMPKTTNLTNIDTTFFNSANEYEEALLLSDNFYSQVVHKTNFGQLPFVFQPNGESFNTDNFAICKIKNNTFKLSQVALNVYNTSMTIEEIW